MLRVESNIGIDKTSGIDVEIVEEFIRVENKEDVKVIQRIQKALDEQITNSLHGDKPNKNKYGLTNQQIANIVGEIYCVLNDDVEGCGLLTYSEELQK